MRQLARLAILQALVLWSVAGVALSRDALQGTTATRPDDEIEQLKRQLIDADAETRERAVVGLLGRTELEAHHVLQEALSQGAGNLGVSDKILMHLAIALTNASHPVFADAKLRPVLVREYVPVLLKYLENGPDAPGGAATLQDRVLRCLRSLTYLERKDAFSAALQSNDPELARAAVRAAGQSRDVSTLAPWLFGLTSDAELGATARAALAQLTFVDGGFADQAAFDAWFTANGQRQFVDLAEEAARRAAETVANMRAEADSRFVQQTARLVAALARTDAPDWAAIRAEVLAPDPSGRTVACLEALRDAMEPRAIGGARPGGVVRDRQTFVDALLARIATGPSSDEYPVLLETIAYLTVLDDTAQRAVAERELIRALDSKDRPLRLAALRGLRRFPSTEHRKVVIELALQALAAKEDDTLTAALRCLREGDWKAPATGEPDEESWLLLLRRVLTDPGLELRQRELALSIATLQDADGALVSRLFQLLLDVAKSTQIDLALRKQVLPRLLQFTRDEKRGEDYVHQTIELLSDPDAEIRMLAARQLENLPEASQVKLSDWNTQIVMRSSDRLLIEPDRKVVSAIRDLLLHVTEDPDGAEIVVGRLEQAALALAAKPRPEDTARREILIDALRVIGVGRDRQPAIWVVAGRGLAELGAREPLRQVLERQQLENLTDVTAPGVVTAFELALDAARLAPLDEPWDQRLPEARTVVHAFDQLEKAGKLKVTSGDRVLRLRALLALGRWDEVVDLGKAALDAAVTPPVDDGDRMAILRAVAAAQIERGDLDDATARLSRLDELAPSGSADVLSLWTKLAEKRIEAGAPADAVQIATRLLADTSRRSPRVARALPRRRRSAAGRRCGRQPRRGVGRTPDRGIPLHRHRRPDRVPDPLHRAPPPRRIRPRRLPRPLTRPRNFARDLELAAPGATLLRPHATRGGAVR